MGGRGGRGGDGGGGGSDAGVELELGLGLSLGGGGGTWGDCRRILTASDFPTVGSKRAAESGVSPPRSSQVVGWPPIGIHRMNSLINQSKTLRSEGEDEQEFKPENRNKNKQDNEDEDGDEDEGEDEGDPRKFGDASSSKKPNQRGKGKSNSGFVKVNLDGIPIGRKVDLNVHASYETLATALEDMFFRSTSTNFNSIGSCSEKEKLKQSKLLDGSSDFVLTYEDKEGDWMLVGDVPWRMFLGSVRRLRILRTSEANGLGFSAPRFHEPKQGQRKRPV